MDELAVKSFTCRSLDSQLEALSHFGRCVLTQLSNSLAKHLVFPNHHLCLGLIESTFIASTKIPGLAGLIAY